MCVLGGGGSSCNIRPTYPSRVVGAGSESTANQLELSAANRLVFTKQSNHDKVTLTIKPVRPAGLRTWAVASVGALAVHPLLNIL